MGGRHFPMGLIGKNIRIKMGNHFEHAGVNKLLTAVTIDETVLAKLGHFLREGVGSVPSLNGIVRIFLQKHLTGGGEWAAADQGSDLRDDGRFCFGHGRFPFRAVKSL